MFVAKNGAQNCVRVNVMVSVFASARASSSYMASRTGCRYRMEYRAMGESELSAQVMRKSTKKNRWKGMVCRCGAPTLTTARQSIHCFAGSNREKSFLINTLDDCVILRAISSHFFLNSEYLLTTSFLYRLG